MTHTYEISGMTCNNCVSKVKSELLKLGDVLSADVQLFPPQATVTMQNHISTKALQDAVSKAGNYSIQIQKNSPEHHQNNANFYNEKTQSWFTTYKPLLLIFTFITGIATLISYQNSSINVIEWMNYFMAGFFIAFSFFKFLDLKAFAESYNSYDLLAQKWFGYGFIYPFLELGLGIAYLLQWQPQYTYIATIIVMGFSCIGVIKAVINKRKIQCACLGAVFNLPMSSVTIIEDVLMVGMAAIMLF